MNKSHGVAPVEELRGDSTVIHKREMRSCEHIFECASIAACPSSNSLRGSANCSPSLAMHPSMRPTIGVFPMTSCWPRCPMWRMPRPFLTVTARSSRVRLHDDLGRRRATTGSRSASAIAPRASSCVRALALPFATQRLRSWRARHSAGRCSPRARTRASLLCPQRPGCCRSLRWSPPVSSAPSTPRRYGAALVTLVMACVRMNFAPPSRLCVMKCVSTV